MILFVVYAFIAAGLQATRGFGSRNAGSVGGHLLLAMLDLAAGIVALVWPSITALALVLVIAAVRLKRGGAVMTSTEQQPAAS